MPRNFHNFNLNLTPMWRGHCGPRRLKTITSFTLLCKNKILGHACNDEHSWTGGDFSLSENIAKYQWCFLSRTPAVQECAASLLLQQNTNEQYLFTIWNDTEDHGSRSPLGGCQTCSIFTFFKITILLNYSFKYVFY